MVCVFRYLMLFTPLQEDMKVLTKVASSPTLLDDASRLDPLMATDGWQTLMTFVRESARESLHISGLLFSCSCSTAVRSNNSSSAMDEDIPQDVLDQIAAEQAASGGGSGYRVCPHCTFENAHGGNDCEVCGLPLQ